MPPPENPRDAAQAPLLQFEHRKILLCLCVGARCALCHRSVAEISALGGGVRLFAFSRETVDFHQRGAGGAVRVGYDRGVSPGRERHDQRRVPAARG